MTDQSEMSRRAVLAGAGAVAGAALLGACGDKKDQSSGSAGAGSAATGGGAGGTATKGDDKGGGASGQALTQVSDVPVGGAVSAQTPDGQHVIVSQPRKGDVVAFSATCTHMGCTVAPAGRLLQCPCHGSRYDLATGKVLRGPAPRALSRIPVKVDDGQVVIDT